MGRIAFYLKLLLFISVISYFLVEFIQQEEIMIALAIVTSIVIFIDSFTFIKKERNSIELGEKFDFKKSAWFGILFPVVVCGVLILIIHYGLPDWFPEEIERTESSAYITLVILIPQGVEHFIAFFFTGTKSLYYATENGLLITMKGDEVKKWNDFYGYSIVEDENLLKFKTKNLKYFSIQYDREYFEEYKKEIISFLDSKLPRDAKTRDF